MLGRSLRWMMEICQAQGKGEEPPPEPEILTWNVESRWEKDADYRRRIVERARVSGFNRRLRDHVSQMGQPPEKATR